MFALHVRGKRKREELCSNLILWKDCSNLVLIKNYPRHSQFQFVIAIIEIEKYAAESDIHTPGGR
jgi:hypothetical protein